MAAPILAHDAVDRRLARACLAGVVVLVAAVAWIELRALPGDGLPMYDEAAHFVEALPVRARLAQRDLAGLFRLSAETDAKGLVHNLVHGLALLVGGPSMVALRVAGTLFLLAALLLLYPLGRLASGARRDPRVGLAAVGFAASCPLLLQWGRSAMVEPINLALNVLCFCAVLGDRERRTAASAALAALALLAAFFCKFNQGLILFGAIFVGALLDTLLSSPLPPSSPSPPSPTAALRPSLFARFARLRPLLPPVLATVALAAWLPFGNHWEGLLHYLTTVKGGGEPVRFDALFYPRTLVERFAPWAGATLLFALAFVVGLRSALRPGVRVLLVHVALGLLLASFNASKRPRLLLPLAPGLLVTAALGAPPLWAWLRRKVKAPRAVLAGALGLLYVAPGWPALADTRIGMPPGLEAVVDAGLDLQGARRPTLWVGSCVVDGEVRLSSHHVLIRGLELGLPDADRRVSYLNDLTAQALERNGAPLADALATFAQVVAISDASLHAPGFSEPIALRAVDALQHGGVFRETTSRTIALPAAPGAPPRFVTVSLWTRSEGR